MRFFYAFIDTLIHSIWQTALLLLFYVCYTFLVKKIHPLHKRNFLYSLLALQTIISFFTFVSIYNGYQINILSYFTGNIASSQTFLHKYADVIFVSYAAIVFCRFTSLLFHWNLFKANYTKSLQKPNVDFKIFTIQKAHQLGIKRKVSLWYSNYIQTPITFGFLKPVVLLPFSLVSQLSTKELEAIIIHELTHIKNKDYLLNWSLIIIEVVFFFNPFVKIIIEKIKLEREKNCDVQVINYNYDHLGYAESLVQIAKNKNGLSLFQLTAAKSTSQLLKRVQFFCTLENLQFKKAYKHIYATLLVPLAAALIFLIPIKPNKSSIKRNINATSFAKKTFYFDENTAQIKTLGIEDKIREVISPSKSETNKRQDLVEDKATIIFPNTEPNNLYKYASLVDTLQNIKEFIYNVETQNGSMIQSYKLIQIKGEWVLIPLWMLVDRKLDSLQKLQIDSVYNVGDTIQ